MPNAPSVYCRQRTRNAVCIVLCAVDSVFYTPWDDKMSISFLAQ